MNDTNNNSSSNNNNTSNNDNKALPSYKDQARPYRPAITIDEEHHPRTNPTEADVVVIAVPIHETEYIPSNDDIPVVVDATLTSMAATAGTANTGTPIHITNEPDTKLSTRFLRWIILIAVGVMIAVAVITSVVLCHDGNCGGTNSPFSSSSSSSSSSMNSTNMNQTAAAYFEDDLIALQNAVDDYYTALLASNGSTDDETFRNTPVVRQYGHLVSQWDVSRVTNFSSLFDGKRNERLIDTFDEDLGNWNVSSAIDMFRMFGKLNIYQGNGLEKWDVSNVRNMRSLFHEAYRFRGNISRWDIQKVKTLTRTFSDCYLFNTDLSLWKTNNVESMAWMFFHAHTFNQDITSWDVRKVEDFSEMFQKARNFNQNISGWTVASAKDMTFMFEAALSFNQDLSSWDVLNNRNFFGMFANAISYNQSLCSWRSAILASTNVTGMFNGTRCLNTSDPTSSDGILLSDGPFCHPCN